MVWPAGRGRAGEAHPALHVWRSKPPHLLHVRGQGPILAAQVADICTYSTLFLGRFFFTDRTNWEHLYVKKTSEDIAQPISFYCPHGWGRYGTLLGRCLNSGHTDVDITQLVSLYTILATQLKDVIQLVSLSGSKVGGHHVTGFLYIRGSIPVLATLDWPHKSGSLLSWFPYIGHRV
jgi:hypothetical protein